MSKIQVPTGEVILRSNGKKRFIMVEDKYQFDDDTWGHIKGFMGIDNTLFASFTETMEEDIECENGIDFSMREYIYYLITEKLSFYANRIIRREDIIEEGLELVERGVYSMGLNLIAKSIPSNVTVREVYSYITLVIQDLKRYMIDGVMDMPWLCVRKLPGYKVKEIKEWESATKKAMKDFRSKAVRMNIIKYLNNKAY
jgi:hypothetical protein